ncbi:galactoside 2-alpha-L-fucosyltransferase, putative [Ricinus communis]|uniref:Fucosyltransferase n=1 Tax=Ricinus communis TaxID=3988 RepID=B9SML8_RICCO|nr:galactoside 2-alpha-L-fucosyltransferase, putative [Ricinus communis]
MEANSMRKLLGSSTMRTISFAACLMALPLIIMLSVNYQDQMFNLIGKVKVLGGQALNVRQIGSEHEPASISDDVLLGGLLASEFDKDSCLSRSEAVLYRKPSSKKPSPYLISKLRNYENLHKRCGPDTESYKRTLLENLLPEVDKQRLVASPSKNQTSKSVLIASLYPQFYENMTNMYWTFPTRKGEVIGVYQPSHEEYQHFGDNMHNVKAWVEMNLLSLSNVLVTSSGSTFGYVAQGLGDLRPWILYRPENWKDSDAACHPGKSMEPCLHIPPSHDCKAKRNFDMGTVVPYVKHCEDSTSGLKLINPDNNSR